MNRKLSGAQLVLVPIKQLGENKFPWVENLKGRFIKYIDFHRAPNLPNSDDLGLTITKDMYITIANEPGNKLLIRNLPLERLNYEKTLGIRQPIYSKICLSDCAVVCQNEEAIGTTAAFIFWYDLPEYSKANSTDQLITDSISVPLVTPTRYNLLPDVDRMAGKRFRRILLGFPNVTPDLQEGVSDYANLYLTLRKGAYNVIDNLPVSFLYQIAMIEKTEFQNIIFDFHSSYITIGGNGRWIEEQGEDFYIGKSVFFNLQYEK